MNKPESILFKPQFELKMWASLYCTICYLIFRHVSEYYSHVVELMYAYVTDTVLMCAPMLLQC